MFPDTAVFVAPDVGSEVRGDPDPSYNGSPTYSGAAYVEAVNSTAARQEQHNVPEGSQVWAVYTPTNPGSVVDSQVTWGSVIFWAIAPAQGQGGGVVWRTWCRDVR